MLPCLPACLPACLERIKLTYQALDAHDPTPPSSRDSNLDPPDYLSRAEDLSDPEAEEDAADYAAASQQYPRKSVYDSRVEQILYENPEVPILITDAGKNHEGGGSYIVYTIRTAVCMAVYLGELS
jgi:hypothetical protein